MNRVAAFLLTIRMIAAVAFLLVAVSAAFLSVRSFAHADQIGLYVNRWNEGDGRFHAIGFETDSGGIVFFFLNRRSSLDSVDPEQMQWKSRNPTLSEPSWIVQDPAGYPYMRHYSGTGALGFGYFGGASLRRDLPMTYADHFIVMPGLFVSAVVGVWPSIFIIKQIRRRKRYAARQCVCESCGYDLRATPQQCPECGLLVMRERSGLVTANSA